MAVSEGYVDHVLELLQDLGPLRVKRMFGGAGVYRDEVMFGLIADESLYLKADEATKPAWRAAGSEPFSFAYKDGRQEITSYWRLPPAAADDGEEAQRWARLGLEAALRAKRPKKRKAAAPAVEALGPGPWAED